MSNAGFHIGLTEYLVFVKTADPAVHRIARRARRNLDSVVGKAKADAAGSQRLDDLEVFALDRRMAALAVGVDQHSVSVLENRVVVDTHAVNHLRRPPEIVDLHGDAWDGRQRFLEEQAARPEFVHAWRMTRLTSNQHNPFVGDADRTHRADDGGSEGQSGRAPQEF